MLSMLLLCALTCATKLLAFDLADALVGQPSGVAAARPTGLDGVVEQKVGQPLQVTVAHKGILGQMTVVKRTHLSPCAFFVLLPGDSASVNCQDFKSQC